jgi:FAD:protein FMN transferase
MVTVSLACQAMATRFELVLQGEDEPRLRAAGEEALAEIQRLEAQLSFYRPSSEVSRLNARAAAAPVRVEGGLFELLLRARGYCEETGGAFDVTVGPLMRCWGFTGQGGAVPAPEALEAARAVVGMHLVELDERKSTVRFARPGVQIDLGAIGKGYALEQAALLLREVGVESALLHGGTSTIQAIGRPHEADAWKVAIEHPAPNAESDRKELLAIVPLRDEALSVSAVWGKAFTADGKVYGHVLDPRLGRPVEGAALAAVVAASATETDALSTALLTLGTTGSGVVTAVRSDLRLLVLGYEQQRDRYSLVSRGIPVQPSAPWIAADTGQ